MENPENHSTINVEATKPHSQHSVEAMKPQSSEETMKPQHKHSGKELNPAKSGNSQKKQYPSPEEKPDKEGTQTFSNSDSRKEVHPSQSPTTSRYWTTNGDNCPSSGHLDSHCCHCEPFGHITGRLLATGEHFRHHVANTVPSRTLVIMRQQ